MGFDHQIDETELQPKRASKSRFRARVFAEWAQQRRLLRKSSRHT